MFIVFIVTKKAIQTKAKTITEGVGGVSCTHNEGGHEKRTRAGGHNIYTGGNQSRINTPGKTAEQNLLVKIGTHR